MTRPLTELGTIPNLPGAACVPAQGSPSYLVRIMGDRFFPTENGDTTAARAVCAGCPVRAECLTWALEQKPESGVWGGVNFFRGKPAKEKVRKTDQKWYCKLCPAELPNGYHRYCDDCRDLATRRRKKISDAARVGQPRKRAA